MRLFVALDIPENVRTAIEKFVAPLRALHREARWVHIGNTHVTLKFIGEVDPGKLAEIEAALATIRPGSPIEIQFRGVGFFPDERRPRVFWTGIAAGDELRQLAANVDAVLEPLGIAKDHRAFSPHLTLARFESPRGLDRLGEAIAAARPLEFGKVVERQFHLYQSVLKRGGAEYTRLATFSLEGDVPQ